ncbi:dihydrofolate reductase family protein [Kribbella sp. NPDC051620]|uniref:dihydrofolate reductase family protein n=1 Tax=Kribbella sp. NPDC051620 TaxID=3364120 RepID=UPI0037A44BD5
MSGNRIVVSVQVSLDGRTAGPGGELDWFVVKDELHAHFVTEHSKAGMFLYGRRTYQGMAGYWPTADEDPGNDQWLVRYSKLWKSMPKAVFSKTMQSADWDTTVLRDIESLAGPRERANGDLYLVGSGEMITELARQDLVDEYQIYVHPVALGAGPSLLADIGNRRGVALADSQIFDQAVVKLTYRRDHRTICP